MNKANDTGLFQLDNGYWGYRYVVKINNKSKESKRTMDELIYVLSRVYAEKE